MNREDLKGYRHTQEWIKGRIEYIEQYKSSINKLISVLSDMPKGSREIQDSEAEKIAELIDRFYIQGKSLVVIAAEMGYNYEHIKRMNGIALNIFDNIK